MEGGKEGIQTLLRQKLHFGGREVCFPLLTWEGYMGVRRHKHGGDWTVSGGSFCGRWQLQQKVKRRDVLGREGDGLGAGVQGLGSEAAHLSLELSGSRVHGVKGKLQAADPFTKPKSDSGCPWHLVNNK